VHANVATRIRGLRQLSPMQVQHAGRCAPRAVCACAFAPCSRPQCRSCPWRCT